MTKNKNHSKLNKSSIPLPEETIWKNPQKLNRTRFDFKYKKKRKEDEVSVMKEKNLFENIMEVLHLQSLFKSW